MQRKKGLLPDYLNSLLVAYIFAFGFSFFAPGNLAGRLIAAVVSGFVFGSLFFLAGYFLPRAKFRSFWLTVLVRSFVICLIMLIGLLCVLPISISLQPQMQGAPPWSPEVWRIFARLGPGMIATWCFAGLLISLAINGSYEINRKLGPGILWNWITGKYFHPKEEERVFMFLDLKNSTPLAEQLGNLRFSRLCQDFFRDLTGPVSATKGEVSHYIGDEAVLTWKPERGLENGRCVRCFFLMQQAILTRSPHYLHEYGIVPEFKAGLHLGLVVAAEVGEIKSEIVYHGDVLNTTARITGLCSEFGSDLLASAELVSRLGTTADWEIASLGPQKLKGKQHEIEICSIQLGPGIPETRPSRKNVKA